MPSLRALRAFEAAARLGSFAAAARELSLTQSAISQQVKLLEEWYGVPLFVRTRNTVAPTPQADALLPTLKAAFDSISEASRLLRGEPHPVLIRIAAMPNFAANWLVPRLDALVAAFPGVDFEIVTAIRPLAEVFRDCDLAIRPWENAPQYTFEHLLSVEMLPVLHPSVVARHRIRRPADLRRAPLIHFARAPAAWDAWFAAAGVDGPGRGRGPARAALHFDSQMVVVEAARRGLGAALGWRTFSDEDLASGRLVAPFELSVPSGQHWYVVLPKALRHGRVGPVRDWLLSRPASRAAASGPRGP